MGAGWVGVVTLPGDDVVDGASGGAADDGASGAAADDDASEVVTLVDGDSVLEEDPALVVGVAWEELEDELPEPTKEAETPVELVQPDGTEPGPPATKRIAAHCMLLACWTRYGAISIGDP